MKKYNRKHIGEKHITNEGHELTVIEGGSKYGYCTIQIEKWISEKNYGNIKAGKIRYPYHKSIFSIGYIGVGSYNYINFKKAYNVWVAMIQRCHEKKRLKIRPDYIEVEISKEWYNFQIFAEWFEKHYIEGWQIDKDLLSGSKKMYSKDTCCFLPPELNVFLQKKQKNNTSGKLGVFWNKKRKKWASSIGLKHLGFFNNIEDAAVAYRKAKKEKLLMLIEKYSNKLEQRALKALKNLKI